MVNTFIIDLCFKKSAMALDRTRLWKQVIEAKSILNTISGIKSGWANHPAVQMWRGYDECLKYYYNCHLEEWIKRGYKNNTQSFYEINKSKLVYPYWSKLDLFINSHRASLLRKNPSFYEGKFKIPDIFINNGYFWPSKHKEEEVLNPKRDIVSFLEEAESGADYRCKGKDKSGKKCEFRAKKKGFCLRHFNQKTLS
jgi:hypothetical protein